ncbi:alpha/beta fold hydrolase [Natrarchaeobius sp. A-rgal3]|uniref:alpha/beta fold hydrolase n=1 Tax=Natrarchaeobius versutus TaxID=1679078 RepID=UPI00350F8AB3
MQSHTVRRDGEPDIHVDEAGSTNDRTILFVHGYSQCRLSWRNQLRSDLTEEFRLVAMDLRGHGRSEKPADAYDDSKLWADDVRAVIDALELEDVLLVGWSYGSLVALDYLSEYGTDGLVGVNLVGIVSELGTDRARAVLTQGYVDLVPKMESTETTECVDALSQFVRQCMYEELPPDEFYYILGFNVIVPPRVRRCLRSRDVSHWDLLSELAVPVLLTHGQEDGVVKPEAARSAAEQLEKATVSLYPETGHSPFWENHTRYNEELREFARTL